ncbi:MAG TPA: phosphopantothenate/pantothenate synthetase [Thermoplasmata archaeon]|nr:phosphopantothenate/pantothenate synthetase [Thermoplasmata archaeon]
MTRLSPRHPRYASLLTRAALAQAAQGGLVVPEGLIAHGRGEAFDYFLGERTSPSARVAIRAAARLLLAADHPVLSVNGNVAALAAREVADVARALPTLRVEVNLFHRTPSRVRAVAAALHAAGVHAVYGLRPTARLAHLDSDRARIDAEGMARADVVLIPLEDGDRARALQRAGKAVISIDLNPLSRTTAVAEVPIVDELRRALRLLARDLEALDGRPPRPGRWAFKADAARAAAIATMVRRLTQAAGTTRRGSARSSPPRPRGTGRRSRRTPAAPGRRHRSRR